jgi:hypothetical protein
MATAATISKRAGLSAICLAAMAPGKAQDANSELAAKATDPAASQMSVQVNDWNTARFPR